MADEPGKKKLKLKLTKTDTNRLKTDTSRQQKVTDDAAAAVPEAVTSAEPEALEDPMALRDTKTGKLRRMQSEDEEANAMAPGSGGAPGGVNETVRLKVVRDGKKPEEKKEPLTSSQTIHLRPSGSAAPAAAGDEAKTSDETLRVVPPAAEDEPGDSAPKLAVPRSKQSTSTLKVGSQPEPAAADEGLEESETKTAVPMVPNAAAKRATSTLKVSPSQPEPATLTQPPAAASNKAETAPATLRVSPPRDALAEEDVAAGDETSTAVPPAAASNKAETAPATLRVSPPEDALVEEDVAAEDEASTAVPPPELQGPASKHATTMLKIRPGAGRKEAAPAPRPAADAEAADGDDTVSGRPTLRLRRQPSEVTQKVEEPAAAEEETRPAPSPAETVPVSAAPEEKEEEAPDGTLAMVEDDTATQPEAATGLRVKEDAKPRGAPRVVKEREAAAAAAAAKQPTGVADLVFSIACAASLAALGVTTALLVKGFLAYCR